MSVTKYFISILLMETINNNRFKAAPCYS